MSAPRRRFRIIKEIAEGGFGKVYLAEQTSADGFSRIVALKLLHAKWSSHEEVVKRTRDEARLLGLLRHQHIVRVEDLTAIDGKCALVMEYLEGVDLKSMMGFLKQRGQHFPRSALFELMSAVCSALDAAYNHVPLQEGGNEPLRVIHRDIKPSNIFVTVNGAIKLLDFGTSRANFAQREAKTQALAFGSQGYMAPERMLGETDTPAADIFSLGVTLYELLALESFGRIPPRPNKFVAKVTDRVGTLPVVEEGEVHSAIADLLHQMMAYEPNERPRAAEVLEICEVIAEQAEDMGVRRFCRTLVAEAKANEPELDSGDPLAGQVVDEDRSLPFDSGATGPRAPSIVADLDSPPPPVGLSPPPGASGTPPTRPPHPPTAGVRKTPSAPTIPPTPRPGNLPTSRVSGATEKRSPARPDTDEKGGGLMVVVVASLGVLALVLMFGALAGTGWYLFSRDTGEMVEIVEPPPVVPVAEPVAPVEPVPEPDVGLEILRAGAFDGGPLVSTVLRLEGAETASIEVKHNGFSYHARWDGRDDADLGAIGVGTYSTFVTPVGERRIRGLKFKVPPNTRNCVVMFDMSTKSWSEDCN